jgi:hypothetical protein
MLQRRRGGVAALGTGLRPEVSEAAKPRARSVQSENGAPLKSISL